MSLAAILRTNPPERERINSAPAALRIYIDHGGPHLVRPGGALPVNGGRGPRRILRVLRISPVAHFVGCGRADASRGAHGSCPSVVSPHLNALCLVPGNLGLPRLHMGIDRFPANANPCPTRPGI